MEILDETPQYSKQRHGCVTAWLVLMIIANSFTAGLYLFASELIANKLSATVPPIMIIVLGVIGIVNIIFSLLLFQWKKIGFWGFIISSIVIFIINLNIGVGIGQSLLGLAGVAILYGVLQIKNTNTSTWENLE